MNELSLFTGGGGGVLASILLGWRTVGYVEWERFCCDRLIDRMREGHLHTAPVWCGDIREFNRSGCASEFAGLADIVTAGFPCQPFSTAGKRRGSDDERNMWPATLEVLDVVRPRWAMLENVPALLTSGYFGAILGGLAEVGFDAEWDVYSAAGVGANHLRKRLWVVCRNANSIAQGSEPSVFQGSATQPCGAGERAHSDSRGLQELEERDGGKVHLRKQASQRHNAGGFCDTVADTAGVRLKNGKERQPGRTEEERRLSESWAGSWWATEPDVGRVANGVAHRVDRLRALGNGQVPAVAVRAWCELSRRFGITP